MVRLLYLHDSLIHSFALGCEDSLLQTVLKIASSEGLTLPLKASVDGAGSLLQSTPDDSSFTSKRCKRLLWIKSWTNGGSTNRLTLNMYIVQYTTVRQIIFFLSPRMFSSPQHCGRNIPGANDVWRSLERGFCSLPALLRGTPAVEHVTDAPFCRARSFTGNSRRRSKTSLATIAMCALSGLRCMDQVLQVSLI